MLYIIDSRISFPTVFIVSVCNNGIFSKRFLGFVGGADIFIKRYPTLLICSVVPFRKILNAIDMTVLIT